MAKTKAKGWDYGDRLLTGNPEELEKIKQYRRDMERKCMAEIKEAITPLFGDEYEVSYVEDGQEMSWGKTAFVEIKLPGAPERAVIYFRYSQGHGFILQKGRCEGLKVESRGWIDINSLGRNYGFDFDTNTVKPATLKKISETIKKHLESIRDKLVSTESKVSGSTARAQEAGQLLKEAGFNVRVTGEKSEECTLIVEGVTHLWVSATGLIYSQGKAESVPVRAKKDNIVEVVKAIKVLRDVVAGGNHEHG